MRKRQLRRELESARKSRDFYFFMLCKATAEYAGDYDEAERLYQMWTAEDKVDGLRMR